MEAKTTLAMLFGLWSIIQRPSTIILVVSSGEKLSSQIAGTMSRMIQTWDILECYRPDRYMGDSVSATSFDVHYSLKGINKSPSISSLSVRTGLAGNRADILISDDTEDDAIIASPKLRARVENAVKEFSAICTNGKILYLGTPHVTDSVYNTLPAIGYTVRVWPGRYPVQEQLEHYGDRLAPWVRSRLEEDPSLMYGGGIDGSLGKVTDYVRYSERDLMDKEAAYGPAGFQLQYMLDVRLSDAQKKQLKLEDLVIANFGVDSIPERIGFQAVPTQEVKLPQDFTVPGAKLYYALPNSTPKLVDIKDILMCIDPAASSDETGYCIGTQAGDSVHVLDCGGIMNGLSETAQQHLIDLVKRWNVTRIIVESNMGHGLYEINLRKILWDAGLRNVSEAVIGFHSVGQKEKRIIDSLLPVMQRHKLVIHRGVLDSDQKWNRQHPVPERAVRSLWYQLSNITVERGCLKHDDRLDALAILVGQYKHIFSTDIAKAEERRSQEDLLAWLRNPMGYYEEPQSTRIGTRFRLKSY